MDIRGVTGAIAAASGRPTTGPTEALATEVRFNDGPSLVPSYLMPLLDGVDTERLTKQEAIATANRAAEARFIRQAMGNVLGGRR